MKVDLLLQMVQNPTRAAGEAITELEGLVAENPYFAAAHLLLLKQYKLQNSSRYQRQLREVAMRLPDRDQVFRLVEDWHVENAPASTEDVVESDLTVVEAAVSTEFDQNQKDVSLAAVEDAELMETAEVSAEALLSEPEQPEEEAPELDVQENLSELPQELVTSEVETKESTESSTQATVEVELPAANWEIETAVNRTEADEKAEAAALAPAETDHVMATNAEITVLVEEDQFLQEKHDRLSWFRFFVGKPLREQPDEVLEQLYQEHMQRDFLQAEVEVAKFHHAGLKAVINHSHEVNSSKSLEEEVKRLAYESISDDDLPASETLAGIYAAQHDYKRAIKIYQKLILKFPDKITYFAGLIEELRKKL